MVVVDRREIEGFTAVEALMRKYVGEVKKQNQLENESEISLRPMSVAVFGPPGSGKSFAVKRIAEAIEGEGISFETLEFNLSQFTSSDQLTSAFQTITNARADRKLPLVFFDEFDSRFENAELGWLRYFLAPMEDGSYRGQSVKTAIFVFAGGTSSTFSDFSMMNRSQTTEAYIRFSQAKGTDFVSRLSGHLNIIGVDPQDENDDLYSLRRAILIRSQLEIRQSLQDEDRANIDPALLRALLRTPIYRHGGRSIRTILDACTNQNGSITRGAIPPMPQLNMIVDAKSFVEELY